LRLNESKSCPAVARAGPARFAESGDRKLNLDNAAAGEMGGSIVGQRHLLDRLLIALLTNGHVLLEGVPGLAKTVGFEDLGELQFPCQSKRLQFTPDMLPADIVGTMILALRTASSAPNMGRYSAISSCGQINHAPNTKVRPGGCRSARSPLATKLIHCQRRFWSWRRAEPSGTRRYYPLPEAPDRPVHDEGDRRLSDADLRRRAILDAMATTEQ